MRLVLCWRQIIGSNSFSLMIGQRNGVINIEPRSKILSYLTKSVILLVKAYQSPLLDQGQAQLFIICFAQRNPKRSRLVTR